MPLLVSCVLAITGALLLLLALRFRAALGAVPAAVVGTALLGYSLLEIFDPDRVRGALTPTLLAIAVLAAPTILILAIMASRLWKKHATRSSDEVQNELHANLAIALGAGALVTFVILLVQTTVQVIDYQQNISNQRQAIQFAMATQSDLSGLAAPRDPADSELLDMSGLWFRGKKMAWASLNNVHLRGANFVFTDLSGALMRGADLSEDKRGHRTDLRAASLYWADLTGARVGNASFVDADLRLTYLCGVDLNQSNLTRADLRGARLDLDPNTGEPCDKRGILPDRSKYPSACWPDEVRAHDGCGAEARLVVCQRDGRVAQRPLPDPAEPRCEAAY
jgi:hypothetical protein